MEKRRRLKRKGLLAELKVRPAKGGLWIPAVLTNIHEEGLGLYVSGALKKKEKVSVRLAYSENGRMRDVEEVPGEVRWTARIGAQTAAGIMFDGEINKTNYPLLTLCLKYVKAKG